MTTVAEQAGARLVLKQNRYNTHIKITKQALDENWLGMFVWCSVTSCGIAMTATTQSRDGALRSDLDDNGVSTSIHYPTALPFQSCHADRRHTPDDFPVAYQATQRILSLPMLPEMTDREAVQSCDVHPALCLCQWLSTGWLLQFDIAHPMSYLHRKWQE